MFGPKIVHQQRNASQLNDRQTNWRPIPNAIHIVRTARTKSNLNSPQAVAVGAKRQKYNFIADVARIPHRVAVSRRRDECTNMNPKHSRIFTSHLYLLLRLMAAPTD